MRVGGESLRLRLGGGYPCLNRKDTRAAGSSLKSLSHITHDRGGFTTGALMPGSGVQAVRHPVFTSSL